LLMVFFCIVCLNQTLLKVVADEYLRFRFFFVFFLFFQKSWNVVDKECLNKE
jgi:hypothetical protein